MRVKYVVKQGQNMLDVAIQEFGSLEAGLFELARQNGDISITDTLVPGASLEFEKPVPTPTLVKYFKDKNIAIATA